MINRLLSFGAILLGAIMMTSCLGDGGNTVTSQQFVYNQCFNAVVDLQESETYVTKSPVYRIKLDYTSAKATIEFEGLKLGKDDQTGLTLKLQDLPMTVNSEGWIEVKGSHLAPVGATTDYEFSNFLFRFVTRGFGYNYIYTYVLDFTVNDRYHVCVIPNQSVFFGSTFTSPVGESQLGSFSTDETYYVINLDPDKMQASIAIGGAKFSDKMPMSLNFTLKTLPFTINGYGYTIQANGPVNPETENNVPNTKYPISDINCAVSMTSGGTLRYNCDANGMGKFNVNATLKYLLKKETNNQ